MNTFDEWKKFWIARSESDPKWRMPSGVETLEAMNACLDGSDKLKILYFYACCYDGDNGNGWVSETKFGDE